MMVKQIVHGIDADIAIAEYPGCKGLVTFCTYGKNLAVIKTSWRITVPGSYALSTKIAIPFAEPELFVPAVLYRKNNCGTGAFPRGGIHDGLAFSEERTPLPGCVLLSEKKTYIAFCLDTQSSAQPAAGVSAHTEHTDGANGTVIEMRIPAVESPFSYQGKTRTVPAEKAAVLFRAENCSETKPLSISRVQFLYSEQVCNADSNTLFTVYRNFSAAVSARNDFSGTEHTEKSVLHAGEYPEWNEWAELKLHNLEFLTEHTDSGKEAYVLMGKGNGSLQNIYDFTGASFLVKSIEAAYVYAQCGKLEQAEAVGRFFLRAESPAESGIYRDNYSIARDEWGGYLGVSENSEYGRLINARCNGEAMLSYIALYTQLAEQGRKIPEFIELPKRVASFYLKCQIRDRKSPYFGSFGRWWTPDCKPVNADGTNGAYIVSSFIALLPYADSMLKEQLTASLDDAFSYYHGMIQRADYYGDTLDADAFDKESAAVLLRESLDAYELTGRRQFLDDACKAAGFVFTWMWQYSVVFPDSTPLYREHFDTEGMTSVSVAHHHLDFYGMYLARDFLRLYKACGDSFYYVQAVRMMHACRQLTATSTRTLGKDSSFAGWQPEQINHTQWDYFDRPDHAKGYFDICIAWETVLTLGAYLQIRRECPEALNEPSA